MSDLAGDLHDRDFYAWTRAQASILRRMAAERVDTELDLVHLIEEIEDLGHSQRDAVRSQVRRVIEHLLKLQCSPAEAPRAGWRKSVVNARSILSDKLTASLRQDVEERLPVLFAQAREEAAEGLRMAGEHSAIKALPASCPYDLELILRPGWYPEPPGRAGESGPRRARTRGKRTS
jgi:hypothetical protein